MKTVTNISVNLYSFDELNKDAQERAIDDHDRFLLTVAESDEQTYFSRSDVADNIEANNYLFYDDGELAHTVTYTATNKSFFIFRGIEYPIN